MFEPDTRSGGIDPTSPRAVRARELLHAYRRPAFVVLALLVLGGAAISYGAYADPDTTAERRVVDDWTLDGDFDHEATVTEPNSVYETGTVHADRSQYFTEIAPTARGVYGASYDAATGENVTVSVNPELVYRSTDGETTYWEETRSLDGVTATDVVPGEAVTATFAVNVSEVETRIDEIESDLGASPGETEVFVRVDVALDGRIDGAAESISQRHEITLAADGGTYAFEEPDTYARTVEETETVTATASPGLFAGVGGPALAVLGAVGLAGVWFGSRRFGPPTEAERARATFLAERAAFEDLLTPTRLPPAVRGRDRAPVDSFERLARLAIDLEAPLIEERCEGRYLVPDGVVVYVYDPPEDERAIIKESEPVDEQERASDAADAGGESAALYAYDDAGGRDRRPVEDAEELERRRGPVGPSSRGIDGAPGTDPTETSGGGPAGHDGGDDPR